MAAIWQTIINNCGDFSFVRLLVLVLDAARTSKLEPPSCPWGVRGMLGLLRPANLVLDTTRGVFWTHWSEFYGGYAGY